MAIKRLPEGVFTGNPLVDAFLEALAKGLKKRVGVKFLNDPFAPKDRSVLVRAVSATKYQLLFTDKRKVHYKLTLMIVYKWAPNDAMFNRIIGRGRYCQLVSVLLETGEREVLVSELTYLEVDDDYFKIRSRNFNVTFMDGELNIQPITTAALPPRSLNMVDIKIGQGGMRRGDDYQPQALT